MAVTKTNFVEYSRCDRFIALEQIRKEKLESKMSLAEYKKEEEKDDLNDLLSSMFEESDDGDIDLTERTDIQLEAMMGYYKEVELEAGKLAKKIFNGKFTYSESTYNQESFDYVHNGIRYLCYTDIYNEEKDGTINIIEVKATTSRNYLDLKYTIDKEKHYMFSKKNNIYYLNDPCDNDEKTIEKYNKQMMKMYDKLSNVGKYIYDLSIQRHIIENDMKEHNKNVRVNYYLAVLNHDYVYDGYREKDKRIYNTINGEDIIRFFNMNEITKNYQDKITLIRNRIEENIVNPNPNKCIVGKYCDIKGRGCCRYKEICFKNVPHYNASYNYIGFKDNVGFTERKLSKYDLINEGYYKLDDIPYEWLDGKPNMIIERNCYDDNKIYVDKEKIKKGLSTIKYPIYHLDFESFPCPMPRFSGEKPYTQSCFEFSLHIEHSPGVCDNDKDNYVFLAETLNDERENMVKEIVKRIDPNNGTMLAQNVSFERTRLKELSVIFPQYREHLLKIVENSTDLIYFLNTNKELYKSLGFTEEESSKICFYNKDMSGSYSIKKTLPVLSNLSYKNLEVKNGTEALVTYSKYDIMSPYDLEKSKKALRVYCKQDTWAMVVILDALRNLVK